MKRIFSIFLCAVVVAALFVSPLSTYAAEDDSIVGAWVFNETIDSSMLSGLAEYELSFTCDSVQNGNFVFNTIKIDANWNQVYYINSTDTTYNVVRYNGAQKWVNSDWRTINIISESSDSNIITWLKANATKKPTHCDGTCAVPDENLDGICEDCGMPFSLRNTGYEYNHSVTFNTANGVIRAEYMSNEPFTIRGYKYGTSYRVEPSIDVYCMTYLNDELTYQGLVAMHYPSYNLDDTVVSSTFDWYTSSSSGEIFFPLPLWVTVEKVTQGEMIMFSNQTVGNLMTLTLCGVGLITLLVGLYLLLRMLRTYLKT